MAKMRQYDEELRAHNKRIADHLGLDEDIIRSTYAESNTTTGATLHVEIAVDISEELFNKLWFGGTK